MNWIHIADFINWFCWMPFTVIAVLMVEYYEIKHKREGGA